MVMEVFFCMIYMRRPRYLCLRDGEVPLAFLLDLERSVPAICKHTMTQWGCLICNGSCAVHASVRYPSALLQFHYQ